MSYTAPETTAQLAPFSLDAAKPLDVFTQQLGHNVGSTQLEMAAGLDPLSRHSTSSAAELEAPLLQKPIGLQATAHRTPQAGDLLTGVEPQASSADSGDSLTQNRQPAAQRSRSPVREPGNNRANAQIINSLDDDRTFKGRVNRSDRNDYFCFNVEQKSSFSLSLNSLQADADVQLLSLGGRVIQSSVRSAKQPESMQLNLEAGTYYVRVSAYGNADTTYRLNLGADPIASSSTQPRDWTVMVYMAADTLEEFSLQDFREMAQIGSDSNVNVVVQLDRTVGDDASFGNWTGTRRGLIDRGDTPGLNWGVGIGEVNMGSAKTLWDFVNWSMTNYQADRYALINWGHGTGFDVSYDDQTQEGISASELNTVLDNLPTQIDLIGADACLMGMTEFAYEISDQASVLVASQELEPGTGWDYTRLLSDLTVNSTMTASQLGSAIVNGYAAYYDVDGDGTETLSAIDLASLRGGQPNSLSDALSSFASTVLSTATSLDLTALGRYRDLFANTFGGGNSPDYCDVGNLFTAIGQDPAISEMIQVAAQAVLSAYGQTVVANYSATPGTGTGLSLYVSERGVYPSANYRSNLRFAADTQWDDLLNWIAW